MDKSVVMIFSWLLQAENSKTESNVKNIFFMQGIGSIFAVKLMIYFGKDKSVINACHYLVQKSKQPKPVRFLLSGASK
jgi:L-cystine uptake protein TcyP (sodium:dicarboxylate symporter family)